MNFVNFEESNMVLGAGPGNENTKAIRALKLRHPEYKTNPDFIAAKFEYDEDEKRILRDKVRGAIREYYEAKYPGASHMEPSEDMVTEIVNCLPAMWVNCMHGWPPMIVSPVHPYAMGYERVVIPPSPQDN